MNPYLSGQKVLEHVFEAYGVPKRIVDLGCGDGGWLKAAAELGAAELTGIDLYNDRPPELPSQAIYFKEDLTDEEVWPIASQHDMVICVETAEHIPTKFSRRLVRLATMAAPLVIWSAAVPGQGPLGPGPSLHENEQDPEFWRALFEAENFVENPFLRDLITQDMDVDPWYRNTATVYVLAGSR